MEKYTAIPCLSSVILDDIKLNSKFEDHSFAGNAVYLDRSLKGGMKIQKVPCLLPLLKNQKLMNIILVVNLFRPLEQRKSFMA